MKSFLILLLLVVITFSCEKETELSATGSLSYKVNGKLVTYDNATSGEMIKSGKLYPINFGESAYEIVADKAGQDNFQMLLFTDSLEASNYYYDSVAARLNLILDVTHYSPDRISARVVFNNDFLDVNITSYANGKISGNFSAQLSPYTTASNSYEFANRGSIKITEGTFSNIKVSY